MCAKKYKTIVVDPPWKQAMTGKYDIRPNRSAELPYQTMSLQEIASLPVGELAADDCHLWLWTTNQFLREGFDVMHSWGFKYLAPIHWIKPNGLGNWFIHRTQTCLFGYRRSCKFEGKRYLPNIIEAPARKHSAKPEASYAYIESVSATPRLELFARRERHGWDVWGNEVPCSIELGAQNTLESGLTSANTASMPLQKAQQHT